MDSEGNALAEKFQRANTSVALPNSLFGITDSSTLESYCQSPLEKTSARVHSSQAIEKYPPNKTCQIRTLISNVRGVVQRSVKLTEFDICNVQRKELAHFLSKFGQEIFLPFRSIRSNLLRTMLLVILLATFSLSRVSANDNDMLSSHKSGGGVGSASPCPVSEHTCDNLQCIPRDKVCNGWDDCGDNSDEHPGCTRE